MFVSWSRVRQEMSIEKETKLTENGRLPTKD